MSFVRQARKSSMKGLSKPLKSEDDEDHEPHSAHQHGNRRRGSVSTPVLENNEDGNEDNPDVDRAMNELSKFEESSFASFDEKHREFQNVLDMVCNASMDAIVMITSKGIVCTVNNPALVLFGYKRWEMVGKNVTLIIPSPFAEKHDFYLQRYMKTRMKRIIGEKRDDVVSVRATGELMPMILKVVEIIDSSGSNCFLATVRNISAAKELQKIQTLMSNIVPKEIREPLDAGESCAAVERFGTVAIFELSGFDRWMNEITPQDVVSALNSLFNYFDSQCKELGIEPYKSDAQFYTVYCPQSGGTFDDSIRVMELVTRCLEKIKQLTASNTKDSHFPHLDLRVGVCTGKFTIGALSSFEKLNVYLYGVTLSTASTLVQNTTEKMPLLVSEGVFNSTNFRFRYEENNPIAVRLEDKNLVKAYNFLGPKSTKKV